MAQPVWVLSVDLQARTATFASGMGDAAKGARASFQDIKAGANEMARDTGYSMSHARHGVMLLGEEFGVHLPRGITTFIASLGPVGAAMEAAFPFLAIIVGATLLIEHLSKVDEAAEKAAGLATKAFESSTESLEEATVKSLELGKKLAELTDGPVSAFEGKLRTANDLLASMKLAPRIKSEFEDLTKSINLPSLWNPLNWFNSARDASKEVTAETKSAMLAIANATTLEEKQENATRELGRAQQELSTIQKMGNEKAIEDQENLIRLLETTKKNMDLQAGNQKHENTIKDLEKPAPEPEPVIHATDPRIAQEHKKQLALYMQTNAEKAKAAEKLAEEEMRLEDGITHYFEEEARKRGRAQEEAGKIDAAYITKMGALKVAADREQGQLKMSAMRNQERARLDLEKQLEDEEYQYKLDANAKELAALDKGGKDYENKLRAILNRQEEIIREHENKITAIKDKAEEDRNKRFLSGEQKYRDEIAKGLTDVLMGHETFAKMMASIGQQVEKNLIQNALNVIMANDMTKRSDAAYAARQGWKAGSHFPFPADLVMEPLLAAAAFTAVLAFGSGGIVPGTGAGDTVPAMLTPGEAVLPKALTEGLMRGGGNNAGGGNVTHMHATFNAHVHAMDAEGVDRVLRDHADTFHKHFANHVRRLNR